MDGNKTIMNNVWRHVSTSMIQLIQKKRKDHTTELLTIAGLSFGASYGFSKGLLSSYNEKKGYLYKPVLGLCMGAGTGFGLGMFWKYSIPLLCVGDFIMSEILENPTSSYSNT